RIGDRGARDLRLAADGRREAPRISTTGRPVRPCAGDWDRLGWPQSRVGAGVDAAAGRGGDAAYAAADNIASRGIAADCRYSATRDVLRGLNRVMAATPQ